ncbi:MAG TPA: tetraacyldisaccharide 4'-kinase [Methyloceanibacter sp.]|jgi:tetraacyldisaccharide 4'-kinase|nr:tetraacyldisaccharide 4'-kinase [Methyloceanibacter sp.]
MRLKAPFWWYRKQGALASALAPLGRLYGNAAEARFAGTDPYRSRLPVICIGNFTSGGGGKTPTAIAVAALLTEMGRKPAFLTRGYGGKSEGPVLVSKNQSAEIVGDEPLLLAEVAPTMVSADRAAGAKAIEASEADVIVMDDGFQNPGLAKDLSLVVVDAGSGIGNGLVMPAGPLRAPLEAQMARADALVVIGDGQKAERLSDAFAAQAKPVLKARMVPRQDKRWLGVLPVIGFAGIARPEKFFATLRDNGARLIDARAYPDHYRYSERQARSLLKEATDYNAMLVTTEKDWVRLPDDPDSAAGELKHRSRPFSIAIAFSDPEAVKAHLAKASKGMAEISPGNDGLS